ncbi:chitin deacetylase [Podochytrium sp. JEL0797]|nr:chitin deacetylase [Podochytrium sp. JEL0797]
MFGVVAAQGSYDFSWAPYWDSGVVAPEVHEWTQYFQNVNGDAPFPRSDLSDCMGSGLVNVWGATFDDGPGYSTPDVVDYFQGVGMSATFWVIGTNVLQLPDTLALTFDAGHQIGIHTWSHPDLTTLTDDQIIAELVYGAKAIYEVLGVVPQFFRPPYGAIDDNIRSLAATMGLQAVTWSEDSEDWTCVGFDNITNVPDAFQSWVDDGVTNAISLEHDYWNETASVVGQNMDILIAAGNTIVTLSECIGETDSPYDNPILQEFFDSGQFDAYNVPATAGSMSSFDLVIKAAASIAKSASSPKAGVVFAAAGAGVGVLCVAGVTVWVVMVSKRRKPGKWVPLHERQDKVGLLSRS